MQEYYAKSSLAGEACQQIGPVANIDDSTVEENIDRKIAILTKEIERLEKSKHALAPLLDMRLRDIREAMSY